MYAILREPFVPNSWTISSTVVLPNRGDRHQEVIERCVIQRLAPLWLLAVQETDWVNETRADRPLHVGPADSHRVGDRQRILALALAGLPFLF
jgi:hypothetical protein